MIKSALHFYSVGLAAENKRMDTNQLNVFPMEALNAYDGELRVNPQEIHTQATDANGNPVEFRVLTDTVLTADWMPVDSNRLSAPDVRRGEEVEIWRLADSDVYYWRSRSTRLGQRTLESSIYAWAAAPDITDEKRNATNSYFLEISTHVGHITLSTSQKNKEPFGYRLQINTRDGKVVLQDQTGNTIYMDSKERVIRSLNSTGSEIAINDKDIYMKAVRDFKVDVGRDMEINVGRDLHTKVKSNETREIGKVRQTKIGNNEEKRVGGTEQRLIRGDRIDTVNGTHTETIKGAFTGNYTTTYSATVSAAYSLQAGAAIKMQTAAWSVTAATGVFTVPAITQTGIYTAIDAVISGKRFSSHFHGNGNNGSPTDKPIG